MSGSRGPIRVGMEVTERTAYASALDWPGWSRSGRTPEVALDALAAAHARYAQVCDRAGVAAPPAGPYEVTETVAGDASTAFGIPAMTFQADRAPLSAAEASRQASLVAAAFAVFDAVVAAAPAELRKGPRGGGRDTVKVVEHVQGAHEGYVRPTGARPAKDATDADRRAAMLAILERPSDGSPPDGARWTPRYAARRIAWHALDHAWEIEDRTDRP